MASADTNILLRWALDDIPSQTKRAVQLLEGEASVDVADAALIEMGYVLEKVYQLDRELVAGYLRAVMGLGQVNCSRVLFSRVLPLYLDHSQLSLIDCYLTVYADLNKSTPLFTLDKKLANQLPAASLLP